MSAPGQHHNHHPPPLAPIASSSLVIPSHQFGTTVTVMDNGGALVSLKSPKISNGNGTGMPFSNGDSATIIADKYRYQPALEKAQAVKQQLMFQEFISSQQAAFGPHHLPMPLNSNGGSCVTILSTTHHQQTVASDVLNHFRETQEPMETEPSGDVPGPCTDIEPDSTTSSLGQLPVTPEKNCPKFKVQEDVLVEHKDGRFYLGTVIAIGNCQCLVRFNDNTECWSDFRELTKLSGGGEADDAPACVVCKRQQSENDSVEVCENCGRGYHVKCMDGNFKRNGYWFCRMCTSPNGKRKDIRYVCSGVLSESLDPLTDKTQLPYDIDSLTWDAQHCTNVEQNYCYCGDDGDWLREMIQCCRCQQWFHGRCIRSLQYPIFLGDRFYFFICSICNHGHEFVRRLEVSWPDLIHLALYNLIARNGKRFYDVTKAIFPYVEDNWKTLQLPHQMTKLSPNARKEIITQTLANDRVRFKCGSEVQKASTMWTLRLNQPPHPSNVLIQPGQIITEHILTQMSAENRIYRFLPRVALERSLVNDASSRERMTGVCYCTPLASEDDACNASDDRTNLQEDIHSSDSEPAASGAGIGAAGELSTAVSGGDGAANCTGKQSSSNLSDSLFSSNAKDGFQLFGTGAGLSLGTGSKPQSDAGSVASGSNNRRAFKSRSKNTESEKSLDIYDSSDDTSRNTLDLIIPPPKNFTGKNNPFALAAVAAIGTSASNGPSTSDSSGIFKGNELKDIIHKANSTSHVSLGSNLVNGELRVARIVKRRLSARDILNGPKSKRRKFRKSSVIGTTITAVPAPTSCLAVPGQSSSLIASLFNQPVDSNGWASQITLSHLLPSSSSSGSSTPANCSYSNVPQATSAACSSSATAPQGPPSVQPKRNFAHGRRLRQRKERNYDETSRRSNLIASSITPNASLPGSPIKNVPTGAVGTGGGENPSAAGTDLQSSLNLYFGATHRILSGEKFVIRGRRTSLSGKVQYLIEWEGCPST